jgi:cyclohexanecarboxylate-CoA ligase
MSSRPFDPVAHARAMRAGGFWVDRHYDEFIAATAAATPTSRRWWPTGPTARAGPSASGWADLADRVARAAAALRQRGVGPGDVVAIQLPNWWEFAVVALATNRVGAVVNPLMPIFREREMAYMLDFAQAKLLVVPQVFRGFDHAAMARGLQATLPRCST